MLGKGRASDIRAEHLRPGWHIDDPDEREFLEERKAAIDQHLAHLTWARVDEGPELWPYPRLVREIVDHVRAYAEDEDVLRAAAGPLHLELERIDKVAGAGITTTTTFFESDLRLTTSSSGPNVSSSWNDPLLLDAFGSDAPSEPHDDVSGS